MITPSSNTRPNGHPLGQGAGGEQGMASSFMADERDLAQGIIVSSNPLRARDG